MNEALQAERHQSLGALLATNRALLLAWLVSFVLHATFLFIAYFSPSRGALELEFDPSEGVALMARLGTLPPRVTEITLPDEVEAVEVVAAEEPPAEDPPAEDPPAEDPPAEDPPAEDPPAEDPPAEEQPSTPTPPTRPAETRPPPSREVLEAAAPRTLPRIPPAEPEVPSEPDPASLPPSERYAEGTRNPVATDIGMWGPEGAQSVMIIRADRIRRSSLASTVEQLISGLPDFQNLLGNTAIDPFEDVDALLIASTDIRYVQRTFIATVHRLRPATLMEQLESGYPGGVTWSEESGRLVGRPNQSRVDPRVFLVPTNGLFIFSRPEFLEPLLDGAPTPRGLDDAMDGLEARRAAAATATAAAEQRAAAEAALGQATADLEAARAEQAAGFNDGVNPCAGMSGIRARRCRSDRDEDRARWTRRIDARISELEAQLPTLQAALDALPAPPQLERFNRAIDRADDELPVRDDGWIRGLLEIADFGGPGASGPAIDWTFQGVRSLRFDGMGDAEPPQMMHASFTLEDDVAMSARFVFENQDQAETWVERWPAMISANSAQLVAFGLHTTFAGAEWAVDFNEATLRTTIPRSTLNRAALMLQLAR